VEKEVQKLGCLCFFKLAKVNNCPMGENSANLVTLAKLYLYLEALPKNAVH
jgi:hypothetical protein